MGTSNHPVRGRLPAFIYFGHHQGDIVFLPGPQRECFDIRVNRIKDMAAS
jgi:hypothetical protein